MFRKLLKFPKRVDKRHYHLLTNPMIHRGDVVKNG